MQVLPRTLLIDINEQIGHKSGSVEGTGDKTLSHSISSTSFHIEKEDFIETQVLSNKGRKCIPLSSICFSVLCMTSQE